MKTVEGKKRCTTVEEVIQRINKKALEEYYNIFQKMEKERSKGQVKSSYLEMNWIDKYYVNPYKVNKNNISFLVQEERSEVIFLFDSNYDIDKIYVRKF